MVKRSKLWSLHGLLPLALIPVLLLGCGSEGRKQAYFDHGMELLARGDRTRARLEFKNVLQIDPRDARAWYQLGELDAAEHQWAEACDAYGKAIEFAPDDMQARLKRGQLLFNANELADALADAEAVVAAQPDSAAGLILRGVVLAGQGDLERALEDARAVLELDPGDRNALALLAQLELEDQDKQGAKSVLEAALEFHPRDVQLRLLLASLYQDEGDQRAVRGQLERLVQLQPHELSFVARLAGYLTKEGDLDGAEHVLRQAIETNPGQVQAKLLLVDWVVQQRGFDPAVSMLRDMIAAAPDPFEPTLALAELYRSASRADQAIEVYRSLQSREKDGARLLQVQVALARLLLEEGRLDEAEAEARAVLTRDARDPNALLVRAAVALGRGDPGRAIADLRNLLQNDPASLPALRLLAEAHAAQHDEALAREALERAYEIAPADRRIALDLAQGCADAGDLQCALDVLRDRRDQDPGDAEVHDRLGQVYAAMSRSADARAEFERAIQLQPAVAAPYARLAELQSLAGDPATAIATLRAGLAATGRDPALLLGLGMMLQDRGGDEEAGRIYQELLQRDLATDAAANNLAMLLVNRPHASADDLRRAAELVSRFEGSDQWVLLDTLGWVRYRNGEFEQALPILEKAARLAGTPPPEMQYHLGMLYLRLGRADEGSTHLREALASGRHFPGIDEVRAVLARQ